MTEYERPVRVKLRIIVVIGLILSILCITFQVVSLVGTLFSFNYELTGTGIWGGIIFLATIVCTKSISPPTTCSNGILIGMTLILVGMSFLVGFLLIGINSANIKHNFDHLIISGLLDIKFSHVVQAMSGLLILIGIASLPINLLIGHHIIKYYLSTLEVKPNNA